MQSQSPSRTESTLKDLIAEFEKRNTLTGKEITERFGFGQESLKKWSKPHYQHLILVAPDTYQLGEQWKKSYEINMPQGILRRDQQLFLPKPNVLEETWQNSVKKYLYGRARLSGLLIEDIHFLADNRYEFEFLPARYTSLKDDYHHIVFYAPDEKSSIQRSHDIRALEGKGLWELAEFRKNTPKLEGSADNIFSRVMHAAMKQASEDGETWRVYAISETHQKLADRPHLPKEIFQGKSGSVNPIAETYYHPDSKTYFFGSDYLNKELSWTGYKEKLSTAFTAMGLATKKIASITFKRVLPPLGISASVNQVLKAEDKWDELIHQVTLHAGGLTGAGMGALGGAPFGPVGVIGGGLIGGFAGWESADLAYDATKSLSLTQHSPSTTSSGYNLFKSFSVSINEEGSMQDVSIYTDFREKKPSRLVKKIFKRADGDPEKLYRGIEDHQSQLEEESSILNRQLLEEVRVIRKYQQYDSSAIRRIENQQARREFAMLAQEVTSAATHMAGIASHLDQGLSDALTIGGGMASIGAAFALGATLPGVGAFLAGANMMLSIRKRKADDSVFRALDGKLNMLLQLGIEQYQFLKYMHHDIAENFLHVLNTLLTLYKTQQYQTHQQEYKFGDIKSAIDLLIDVNQKNTLLDAARYGFSIPLSKMTEEIYNELMTKLYLLVKEAHADYHNGKVVFELEQKTGAAHALEDLQRLAIKGRNYGYFFALLKSLEWVKEKNHPFNPLIVHDAIERYLALGPTNPLEIEELIGLLEDFLEMTEFFSRYLPQLESEYLEQILNVLQALNTMDDYPENIRLLVNNFPNVRKPSSLDGWHDECMANKESYGLLHLGLAHLEVDKGPKNGHGTHRCPYLYIHYSDGEKYQIIYREESYEGEHLSWWKGHPHYVQAVADKTNAIYHGLRRQAIQSKMDSLKKDLPAWVEVLNVYLLKWYQSCLVSGTHPSLCRSIPSFPFHEHNQTTWVKPFEDDLSAHRHYTTPLVSHGGFLAELTQYKATLLGVWQAMAAQRSYFALIRLPNIPSGYGACLMDMTDKAFVDWVFPQGCFAYYVYRSTKVVYADRGKKPYDIDKTPLFYVQRSIDNSVFDPDNPTLALRIQNISYVIKRLKVLSEHKAAFELFIQKTQRNQYLYSMERAQIANFTGHYHADPVELDLGIKGCFIRNTASHELAYLNLTTQMITLLPIHSNKTADYQSLMLAHRHLLAPLTYLSPHDLEQLLSFIDYTLSPFISYPTDRYDPIVHQIRQDAEQLKLVLYRLLTDPEPRVFAKSLSASPELQEVLAQNQLLIEQNKLLITALKKAGLIVDAFEPLSIGEHCERQKGVGDMLVCIDLLQHTYEQRFKLSAKPWFMVSNVTSTCVALEGNITHCVGEDIESIKSPWFQQSKSFPSQTLAHIAFESTLFSCMLEVMTGLAECYASMKAGDIKWFIHFLLAFLTGSWLGMMAGLMIVEGLKKLGCSQSTANSVGSGAALAINVCKGGTASLATLGVSYAGTLFGSYIGRKVLGIIDLPSSRPR